jgi:hypothetical protein
MHTDSPHNGDGQASSKVPQDSQIILEGKPGLISVTRQLIPVLVITSRAALGLKYERACSYAQV